MFKRLTHALLLGLVMLLATTASTGCGKKPSIPGTEIPDTPQNREVLQVLERYRKSFVRKDAAQVLATAHKTYHDEGGTDDPNDDVSYTELAPLLRRRLSQIDSIRFTIDYLEVHVHGDRAVCRVWIDASFRMKPLLDSQGLPRSQPIFSRTQDYNEFELIREGNAWLISRGM